MLNEFICRPGVCVTECACSQDLSFEIYIRSTHDTTGPGMIAQRRFKRMLIDVRNDFLLLHLGEMEIWDGADLALLRESLFCLIDEEGCESIAIDMLYVKYIPSGFFGMLFDWQEKCGTRFALTPPQPNVQRMLWFRQFFKLNNDGMYELLLEPTESLVIPEPMSESCLSSQSV